MKTKVALLFTACAAALAAQTDTFTAIVYPGASMTHAMGINDAGDIVGEYYDAGGAHGFLLSGGKFTSIDFPGAKQTLARGINNRGDISGLYNDGTRNYGFSYNRGLWGTSPYPKEQVGKGFGIRLLNSNKAAILDNRALNNSGTDLSWDGNGENRFDTNACGTSPPRGRLREVGPRRGPGRRRAWPAPSARGGRVVDQETNAAPLWPHEA